MTAILVSLFFLPVVAESSLSVSVEPGEHWHRKMRVLFITVNKSEDGDFVDTIMVTDRTAKQEWRSAPEEGRPESLPVWTHASAQSGADLDAATSATPEDTIDTDRRLSSLVPGARYRVLAEVNHSYDYNDRWQKKAEKGSERFSGVNGQPSIVYEGILVNKAGEQVVLVPVGQGSVDGSTGAITKNLEGLTTALSIVETIRVSVESE